MNLRSVILILAVACAAVPALAVEPVAASVEPGCASPLMLADRGGVEASFTFEGCWTYFPTGPCRDIYVGQGSYWLCKACGQTSNPGPGQCSPISLSTLNIGWWCS